jgi:hypothetical protein
MSEECRASHTDDQDFQPSCLAWFWFKLVDSRIQHGGDQADEDIVKAEKKQAAPPETPY